jgi:death-on-curing protein
MTTVYLTVAQVLEVRALVLEATGTEPVGAIKLGDIESILGHCQNNDYYPTFEAKLTHVFFGLTKAHCFLDGNKRTAVGATMYMLLLNGHHECAATFIRDMEDIVVAVADNLISKAFLQEIVTAAIRLEFSDNEELKTKILDAITSPKED